MQIMAIIAIPLAVAFAGVKKQVAFGAKQGSTRDLLDASLAAPSAVSTMSEEEWKKGFEYEIAFWDNWFKSKGSQWPDDYKERLKADKPFYFRNQLKKTAAFGEKHFTALSVGAGPLERAGFVVSPWLGLDATLEMIATDPLAKVYDTVLMKYGVVPPLRTRYAKGEELASYFAADFFDISYSLNALDHVQEPMIVLHQMVIVTKPGHQVIIEGNSNEAINENYVGFHQWNNACDNGKFIIWSRGKPTIDVAAVLGPVAKSVTCSGQTGRVLVGKMVAIITKAL
jgi:hypothetical protein